MIPYVVIFENNSDGDRIDGDIYDYVNNVDDLKDVVKNIIKSHVTLDYYLDEMNNGKFENLCEYMHNAPYESEIYFELKYFNHKVWTDYHMDEIIEACWATIISDISKKKPKKNCKKVKN
jgi:hypothetical protein